MLLKSLQLINFRSYTEQRVFFKPGTILLGGDIGSGKSSILLAIEFALFGIKRDELSPASLLRKGASQGSVVLAFQLGGSHYSIKRTLKKAKSIAQGTSSFTKDGNTEQLTPQELKAKVLEIFGYPLSLIKSTKDLIYRYTVYTPQEHIKHILLESNEDRLTTLRRVFGIDKYKIAIDNKKIIASEIKLNKRGLEGEIAQLPQIKETLAKQMEEILATKNELKKANIAVEQQETHLKALKNSLDFEEKRVNQAHTIGEKVKNFQKRKEDNEKNRKETAESIKTLSQTIQSEKEKIIDPKKPERLLPISQLEELHNKRTQQNQELQTSMTTLQANIQASQEKIKFYKEKLETKQTLQEVPKPEENSYEKQLNEFAAKKISLQSQIVESEKSIEKIPDLEICPTCLQPIDKLHLAKLTNENQENIVKYKREVAQILEQETVLREKNEKYLEAKKSYDTFLIKKQEFLKAEKEKETISIEKQALESKILEMSEKHKKVAEEQKTIQEKISKIEILKTQNTEYNHQLEKQKLIKESIKQKEQLLLSQKDRIDHLTQEQTDIIQYLEMAEKEFASYENIEDDFKKKKVEYEEQQQILQKLLANESTLNERMRNLDNELAQKNEMLQGLLQKEKNIAQMTSTLTWLDSTFTQGISTIEKNVMATIYHEFNHYFQEAFGILMEDNEIQVRLDAQFAPMITQNGHDAQYSHLSGGEKTALALAYRIALNQVINKNLSSIKTKDLLILDEPTDGFSYEQLDKMRDLIQKLKVQQLIIVSHEKKIETFVENIIKVQKVNHVSSVSSNMS